MPTPQRPGTDRSRQSRMQNEYTWQGGWAHPEAPRPSGGQPGGRAPLTPQQQRALARRRRERRRRRRRTLAIGTAGGILVLSGIITLLLPKSVTQGETPAESTATGSTQLVAPLPYGGADQGTTDAATPAINWGTVGPVQQTAEGGYTYTAVPAAPASLPEFGRVDTSWFADAAFLGDSLTAGFCESEYNIDVGGALICGYEGISPNSIVNRTTVTSPDRGDEVAMDVLTNAQPAKLYILIGTNALVTTGNDESFLKYYGRCWTICGKPCRTRRFMCSPFWRPHRRKWRTMRPVWHRTVLPRSMRRSKVCVPSAAVISWTSTQNSGTSPGICSATMHSPTASI